MAAVLRCMLWAMQLAEESKPRTRVHTGRMVCHMAAKLMDEHSVY
jgi:hypothetical protein